MKRTFDSLQADAVAKEFTFLITITSLAAQIYSLIKLLKIKLFFDMVRSL